MKQEDPSAQPRGSGVDHESRPLPKTDELRVPEESQSQDEMAWARRREALKPWIGLAIAVSVILVASVAVAWMHFANEARKRTSAGVILAERAPWHWSKAYADAKGSSQSEPVEVLLRRRLAELQKKAGPSLVDSEEIVAIDGAIRTLRATRAAEDSLAAEAEFERLRAEGRIEAALEKAQAALAAQAVAEARTVDTAQKDSPRQTRLQQAVVELAKRAVEALGREGTPTADAGDEARVLSALQVARAKQVEINGAFRDTLPSGVVALETLDAEIQTLAAQPLAKELKVLWERAEGEADAEPDPSRESFKKAHAICASLAKRFPKSRQAAEFRIADIEVARDTALSRKPLATLRSHEVKLAEHLNGGRWEQAESELASCRALGDMLTRELPLSLELAAAGLAKFEYLAAMWAECRKIRRGVEKGLAPIGSAQVAREPVTQELFSLIMSWSPSRSRLPSSPVTEVNYLEAAEFCRRLGWLMGAPVRLPQVDDLQALRSATSLSKVVAGEWLDSVDVAASTALVVALPSDASDPVPTRAGLRSREIGFRFVVGGSPRPTITP